MKINKVKIDTVMKISTGFSKMPHTIWETDKLTLNERALLAFIIDRANKFNKEENEFTLSMEEFKKIGFEKRKIEKCRKKLIDLNLITYKRGHTKVSSSYSVNWFEISNLTSDKEETGITVKIEPQVVEIKEVKETIVEPKTEKESKPLSAIEQYIEDLKYEFDLYGKSKEEVMKRKPSIEERLSNMTISDSSKKTIINNIFAVA